MNLREQQEAYEIAQLSPLASKSAYSKGRKRPSNKCDLRTEFQKDRDKITHCKAFRRLMHKTQVFISPEGDHYRTRLTHTLEVAQIARTVSRGLRLNEDLTEAIALGHDLGHTPFGHTGEDSLHRLSPDGFRHNEQSVRVVEFLEDGGAGLNLTFEVTDGIFNHRTTGNPSTPEGTVVQLSDKIAYVNHDIDDALRSGLLKQEELPKHVTEALGTTSRERINFLVHNLVAHTLETGAVALAPYVADMLRALRAFLFTRVYQTQLQQKEREKIQSMLRLLFEYYVAHADELPQEMLTRTANGEPLKRAVCDYIAGMTDRFALKRFSALYMPEAWEL